MSTPDAAELELTDAPDPEALAVITTGLAEYSAGKAGYRDARPLAIIARDPGSGQVVGGLIGRTSMGLCFIDRFFLPETLRGHGLGSRILATAEAEAMRRGCRRAVLFTVHFQAPKFYERHGWEVLGRLDLEPPGHTRYCMTKRLGGGAS
jgi:GNAT superfamily N-acetyltransferase